MRVFITGATGYVGSWTARAIQQAGHQTRLLVRSADKAARFGEVVGFDTGDLVVGDVRDEDVVREGLADCDAVIHAAAIVDVRTGEDTGMSANLDAAHVVLGAAAEAGLDPIVHVSSTAALWAPGRSRLHRDLEVGEPADSYGASKIAVEEYARQLQDDGEPVVIVYPGGIVGPPAGQHLGEAGDGLEAAVKFGAVPGTESAFNVIDVRDLALAHVAILEPGHGPRRYVIGGRWVGGADLAADLQARTGHRVRHIKVPGRALIALGRFADRFRPVMPSKLESVSEGSMKYLVRMPPTDDAPVHDELGITPRPLAETMAPLCDEIVRRLGAGPLAVPGGRSR